MTNSLKKPHLDLLLIKKIGKLEVKAHAKKQSQTPPVILNKKPYNWWKRFCLFWRKFILKIKH